MSTHARSVVDKISPEVDISKLTAYIPRSLASAIPDRILYQNGHVGECNDLIFGFSLLDYAVSHNLQEGEAPKIVQICLKEIDQRGLESEGIYRVNSFSWRSIDSHKSGCTGVGSACRCSICLFPPFLITPFVDYMWQMQHEIERDESKFEFKPKDDIYAVASLLKVRYMALPWQSVSC